MAKQFARNSTAKDFLKYQSCETLDGITMLSAEERYEQVRFAQRVRNFWFTATSEPFSFLADPFPRKASTPPFSEPVIITDILSMYECSDTEDIGGAPGTEPPGRLLMKVKEYGGRAGSLGEDFYGLSGETFQEFIVKHEKAIGTVGLPLFDIQGKLLTFTPRLLEPYQSLRVSWNKNPILIDVGDEAQPQLGFRAIRTLRIDDPYSYLKVRADVDVKNYIAGNTPVTFLMQMELPFATIGALSIHKPAVFKTEQQSRPLLILGACSNIEGAQATLYDESSYYDFTLVDPPLVNPPKTPFYDAVPLNLWAPNTDFRTANLYNMFPVPHFLEPGAQLKVTIYPGLIAQWAAPGGFFLQQLATRNSQDGRITFLCRTV